MIAYTAGFEKRIDELAMRLRSTARDVEAAAKGDEDARNRVAALVDGYWHQIVIGDRDTIAELLSPEEIDA